MRVLDPREWLGIEGGGVFRRSAREGIPLGDRNDRGASWIGSIEGTGDGDEDEATKVLSTYCKQATLGRGR
jgi:hypothetical protein